MSQSDYASPYANGDVTVYVGDRVLTVSRVAAPWVECVMSPVGPSALLAGLPAHDAGAWVLQDMVTGVVTPRDVSEAAYALLGAVSPFSWWKTARLLALSSRPDICGRLSLERVDPWSLTVAQWVCAVYALITRGLDETARFKINAPLDDPPAGVVDDNWMSDAEFAAMVAQSRNAPGQT